MKCICEFERRKQKSQFHSKRDHYKTGIVYFYSFPQSAFDTIFNNTYLNQQLMGYQEIKAAPLELELELERKCRIY